MNRHKLLLCRDHFTAALLALSFGFIVGCSAQDDGTSAGLQEASGGTGAGGANASDATPSAAGAGAASAGADDADAAGAGASGGGAGSFGTAGATGQKCSQGSDCASKVCSAEHTCAVPTCKDGQQNANETDVDCGGFNCGDCQLGQGCKVAADCVSGLSCYGGACTDAA
jgi:hypothetical protein